MVILFAKASIGKARKRSATASDAKMKPVSQFFCTY
jgi:hypothetical protein